MTLAELRTKVKERLAGLGAAPYTDTDINEALNQAQREFAFLSLCVERTIAVQWQPNAVWRSMLLDLADWILPLRVRCHVLPGAGGGLWDGGLWDDALWDDATTGGGSATMTPVKPVTIADLDALDTGWQAERDETVERYGCIGMDLFFVYPAPDQAGTSLEIVYAAEPAEMVNDYDEPEMMLEDHQSLIDGAISLLPLALGGAELKRVYPSNWQRFQDAVARRAEYVRMRSVANGYDRTPAELALLAGSAPK